MMSRGLEDLHSEYLYRVLRPNESPHSNLLCCDRNSPRRIDQHVESGLTEPSRFISTTSDFKAALKWLDKANEKCLLQYFNRRRVIVRIDVRCLKSKYPLIAAYAYDLSNSMNRDIFLKTEKQKKFSESYHEVVFIDVIPSDVFIIYYIHGEGFVRNPTSRRTQSPTLPPCTSIKFPPLLQSAFYMHDVSESNEESISHMSSANGISFQPGTCKPLYSTNTTSPIESNDPHFIGQKSDCVARSPVSSASALSIRPVNKPHFDSWRTYQPISDARVGSDPACSNTMHRSPLEMRIPIVRRTDSNEEANRRTLLTSSIPPLSFKINSTLKTNKPILNSSAESEPASSSGTKSQSSRSLLVNKPRFATVSTLKPKPTVYPSNKLAQSNCSPIKTDSRRKDTDHSEPLLSDSFDPHTISSSINHPPSFHPPPKISNSIGKTVQSISFSSRLSPHESLSKIYTSSKSLDSYIQSANSGDLKIHPKNIKNTLESRVRPHRSTTSTATQSGDTSIFKLRETEVAHLHQRKYSANLLDESYRQLDRDLEASMKIVKKTLLFHSKLFRLNKF